jgi:ATP-dependent protease HslVU (ClpYQ) peptidase subunit
MSTVTAVKKDGKIAIACDSLIKWGSEKNTAKYIVNHNKILKVDDSYMAVTGPAAGILALKHYFKHTENKYCFDNVDDIFITFRDLQQALKDDYGFEVKSEDTGFEPNSMYILIVNPHGIFAVGSYRDVQEFKTFYAYGSGNEYALGAMFDAYEKEKLSAEDVAKLGIKAAAEFDDATALPLISYVVDEK